MPQPVEIPFSVVRDHAAVRHLNAAAFGAYSFLVMAALWDGVNLAEQNDASLALLAQMHGLSWRTAKKAVLKALADTLPKLRVTFGKRSAEKERHIARSYKGWIKAYAVRMAKSKARNAGKHIAELDSHVPTIFQPHKDTPFRSQSTDLPALSILEKRIKSTPKGKTLAETKA